jgi:tetratricopeptide (TPR) repeat protein
MEEEIVFALKKESGQYAWNLAALADVIAAYQKKPADYRLGLATYYYQNKNYNLAMDICVNILFEHPKDSNAILLKGMLLEVTGDKVGAFTEYNNAIKYNGRNARAHYQLGLLYLKVNQTKQAQDELFLAKKLDPSLELPAGVLTGSPAVKVETSTAKSETPSVAVPSNTKLPDAPKVTVAIEGGVDNTSTATKAEDFNQFKDAESALQEGDAFYLKGNWDTAILAYKRAIELNPSYSKAYAYLGTAYMRKAQVDEAITALKKSVELDPKAVQAYRLLGNALELKFDLTKQEEILDEAIFNYLKALDLDPNDVPTKEYLRLALKKKE